MGLGEEHTAAYQLAQNPLGQKQNHHKDRIILNPYPFENFPTTWLRVESILRVVELKLELKLVVGGC